MSVEERGPEDAARPRAGADAPLGEQAAPQAESTAPLAVSTAPLAVSTAPLAGRRIGVTAHRRALEQIGALERQGASVLHAPTMRIVPVGEDSRLVPDTEAMLAAEPVALLVTTGQGFTTWLDALPPDLRERTEQWIASVRVFCRGAKARGAVRGRGFSDPQVAPGETTQSLVDIVLAAGLRDAPLALQRHGYVDASQIGRLEEVGCAVRVVAPYRWESAGEPALVDALITEAIAGRLDAITFTAGPAVIALLESAERTGRRGELIAALQDGRCRAVAVGHVTAQPLEDAGIPVTWPDRERLGALVKHLVDLLG